MPQLIAVIVILSSAAALAEEPPLVGARHELFIDDHLVSRMEGLKRTLHQPQDIATNPVIVPEHPWEHRRIPSSDPPPLLSNRPATFIVDRDGLRYERRVKTAADRPRPDELVAELKRLQGFMTLRRSSRLSVSGTAAFSGASRD